jgi:glutathione gamma-glutamylcysteinyltransferase
MYRIAAPLHMSWRSALLMRRLSSKGEESAKHASDEAVSFHKRVLPGNLVSLSSPRGKTLFKEALQAGDMECFFPLSEQFLTQSEPAFCALSSLAMVLNALNHDPGKVWKGVWRWTSEDTLRCESESVCGHAFENFKVEGVNFSEFESLAACHGVEMLSYRVGENTRLHDGTAGEGHDRMCGKHELHDCQHIHHGNGNQDDHHNQHHHHHDRSLFSSAEIVDFKGTPLEKFRSYLDKSCRSDKAESFIIANFDRQVLGQTGSGHFSPIGGYNREHDLALIMDVARFKYPPWWVPVEELWRAMSVGDPLTQEPRGYFICSEKDIINSAAAIDR